MKHHPRTFVIQLGSLIALYISVTALILLLFGVVDLRHPDEAMGIYAAESARESIRMNIALLVVFFPTFLVLTRLSQKQRRAEADGEYIPIAKWLVYLSLLVAGGALLGDLVALIVQFLNGELTIRFLLKAFIFFAVVGSAFTYFVLDVRGYFRDREKTSLQIGALCLVVVLISLVAGFTYIETPAEVREMRIDERQITDLQDIQWRIEEYYQVRGGFPESIDDLYIGERVPAAPDGRPDYRYVLTSEDTYELCATFAHESRDLGRYPSPVFPAKETNYTWGHGVGEVCFTRVIESRADESV